MNTSIFRPFWSYDPIKTEKWLEKKASEGLFLTGFNRWSRKFHFEKDDPETCTYRLQYEKVGHFPQSLVESGWETITKEGSWRMIRHKGAANKEPLRDSLASRNKVHYYIFLAIFIYMLLSAGMVGMFSLTVFLGGGSATFVPSPYWAITITAGLILWTLVPYSTLTLHIGLKKLKVEPAPSTEQNSRPITFTKVRLAWACAPDRLEKWLETMEQKGYRLVKVSRWGLRFSFSEGEPRNVSYAADCQKSVESDYFYLHSDRGWRQLFHSSSSFMSWTLWAKAYNNEEEKPQLYSDSHHKLKHAKRVTLWQGGIFLPLTFIYIWVITLNIDGILRGEIFDATFWMVVVQTIVVIEFGYFSARSLLYYWRVRKMIQ
ncbi:Protein of unknown function [Halobacillus alkaliphilus]|uniref:DUF2812 domain-containing protein n=1 Tax=Halobacillus alkaliphilus TaxID=396056 RepID=A0A1I2RJ14_9BACI|nr:DUF2812 domain-containing protein [Halobacillus alkaliphilus]SFG38617.1 Protein of unknown function [Halobacillus alkaliphilus]